MSRKRLIHTTGRRAATLLRLAVAACLFCLTVLQGLSFCLCAPDPDACGTDCHDCAPLPDGDHSTLEHLCEHLDIAFLAPGQKSDGLRELLGTLLTALPAMRQAAVACPAPDALPRLRKPPPEVLFPQLAFLARSAQRLY